jgi:DNA-binding transcriptional MerR regulator
MVAAPNPPLYGIADLAGLGGVSRRTVRFYVQEGLLPAPRGVGRGDHYGPEHVERLLAVKRLQEEGLSLEEIRRSLASPGPRRPASPIDNVTVHSPIPASPWTRLHLAPGVELHVASHLKIPPPGRLADLAALCGELFSGRPPSAGPTSADDRNDRTEEKE